MFNQGLHKVKVNAWGVKDKLGNGLDNFIDQELFGGNNGHISIEMTLPTIIESQKMIEQYCMEVSFEQWIAMEPKNRQNATFDEYIKDADQIIPVRLVENIITRSLFNDNGELVGDKHKKASAISYYKIDFSFWPNGEEHIPFYLASMEEDMIDGRKGHHIEYSDAAKKYLQPEERIHKGIMGAKSMTYAPMAIAHQRDMDEQEFAKIGLAMELQKLTEALEAEDLLVKKVKALKAPKIEGSLGKICHNIGLKTTSLVKEYMAADPLARGRKIDIKKFKEFFLQKITDHTKDLQSKKQNLQSEISDIDAYLNQDRYVTRGIRPSHTQELPYYTEMNRGLDPEAMLKKMREIPELLAPKFNIFTTNCSKICTEVLKAGAAHDPLLEHALGEEVLGAIATPEQVISNAQRANNIIVHNRQNTFLTRMANSSILDRTVEIYVGEYLKYAADYWEHITQPQKKIKEHQQQIDEHQKQINKHQQQIDEYQQQIDEPQQQINEPQQQINEHQKQIDEHQKQIDEHQKNIAEYQEKSNTSKKKAKAIAGIVGISILKIPGVLLHALVNPIDTISNITNAVSTVFKNANSLLLKSVVGILSVILIAVLTPFAIVGFGLKVLAAPFKALGNRLTSPSLSPKLEEQITSPLPSKHVKDDESTETFTKMAGLLNKEVAKKINKNTQKSAAKNNTAMDILTQFEIDLENTEKIVILSAKDFDTLNKYVGVLGKKKEPTGLEKSIIERFQKCCKDSLNRANKLSPHTPAEVDAIVDEIEKKERIEPMSISLSSFFEKPSGTSKSPEGTKKSDTYASVSPDHPGPP